MVFKMDFVGRMQRLLKNSKWKLLGTKMSNFKMITAGLVLSLSFGLNAEAKLYKWVDDNGSTHYGEKIPPEFAGKDKDVETPQKPGMRDKRIEILSPEMIHAQEEEAAKKAAAKKEMEDNKRRDHALLNTYSSEQEIDLARDRSLALINGRIESNNILLKSAQNSLNDLNNEIAERGRQGKKIPQSLYDDIALAEDKVSRYQLERSKNEELFKSAKTRFENDKILYRRIVVNPAKNPEKNDSSDYSDGAEYNDYAEPGEYSDTYRRSKKAKARSRY